MTEIRLIFRARIGKHSAGQGLQLLHFGLAQVQAFPVGLKQFERGQGGNRLVGGQAHARINLRAFDEVKFKRRFGVIPQGGLVEQLFQIARVFDHQARDRAG